jgi:hypothetical protein
VPETTIITLAKDWWAMMATFAGVVLWFGRLEARTKKNSEDVKKNNEDLREHKISMKEQRAEDLANRQRDWDNMNGRLDGIQSDIKELLQRTAK